VLRSQLLSQKYYNTSEISEKFEPLKKTTDRMIRIFENSSFEENLPVSEEFLFGEAELSLLKDYPMVHR
jgi:hypothetical protein